MHFWQVSHRTKLNKIYIIHSKVGSIHYTLKYSICLLTIHMISVLFLTNVSLFFFPANISNSLYYSKKKSELKIICWKTWQDPQRYLSPKQSRWYVCPRNKYFPGCIYFWNLYSYRIVKKRKKEEGLVGFLTFICHQSRRVVCDAIISKGVVNNKTSPFQAYRRRGSKEVKPGRER